MKIRVPMLWVGLSVVVLAGCASDNHRAPVADLTGAGARATSAPVVLGETAREGDWRPKSYIVQKGETLYSIAFNHGLDYRDVAALNNITDPDVIQVGQELRLLPSGVFVAGRPVVAARPEEVKLAAAAVNANEVPVVSQPQIAKLPYSESAIAQIQAMQVIPAPAVASVPNQAVAPNPVVQQPELKAAPVVTPPVSTPTPPPVPTTASAPVPQRVLAGDELDWGMPADGKLISGFSESANSKGIDIAGKLGQPVLASAAGKVVYSGSGLRGYGKLVIIKHNNTYLSAYAHNSQILVKEGQTVSKGQKIAEMGNTDADQVKLHFEIRKLGKPVDPARYLPNS